ncbi:Gag-Pol poly [Pyrrhoderma noxium]|uniref:Gag-Pol poly n=1 Tax=Pyrrhoderma noxium TaxID=2282107 RepID=A0A286UJG5_9AGAM|nr:Gag-Pol poly [Pyrrhoderma noxium]
MLKRPDAAQWIQAAHEEIQALLQNGTWTAEELPQGRKAVGNRWVFKLKRKPDGSIERYKARLAALRTIMALVAIEDLELISADISNVFLNGKIDHEVYMDMPEGSDILGLNKPGAGYVLKLLKALYGLKQAGRQWYKKLDSTLSSMGFNRIKVDHTIWVFKQGDICIIMPAYVDDLMIVTKKHSDTQKTLSQFSSHFKLRDLGPTSFILGVQVERDRSKHSLSLSQHQYIVDLLEHYHIVLQMKKSELKYISFVVGKLGQFSSNLGIAHWKAAQHLLRHLQGTKSYKLTYAPDPSQTKLFTSYTDTDFAGDRSTRRSTSGIVIKVGTGAVSWSSKLQGIVTLSTTEAEYVAAVTAGQEVIWLRYLLTELGWRLLGSGGSVKTSALAVLQQV